MTTTGPQYPRDPWRLDTNNRYRDAVKVAMDLSTASLVIPIFFLRDIPKIPREQPLYQVLTCKIYWAWTCLGLALLLGFVFYYASAKWVRLAWGKEAGFFGVRTTDWVVERVLDVSFGGAIIAFVLGVGLILWFVVAFSPEARSIQDAWDFV